MCNCQCEKEQQSNGHEWGPVDNSETILLVGIDPRDCVDGELLSTTISHNKLKKANQSVVRKDFSSHSEIMREVFESAKQKEPKSVIEYGFCAVAADIREIKESEGIKIFCVIDSAIMNESKRFPSHASLLYADAVKENQNFWARRGREISEKQAVIANLVELFQGGRRRIEEVFEVAA